MIAAIDNDCYSTSCLRKHFFWTFEIYSKSENGEQCIQLAICETNQRGHIDDEHDSKDPDSLVKELLRVVFR